MKISEKTLELNFCTQFSTLVRPWHTLWFGPTQRQEARWGFDASSKLGGQHIVFQFKTSKRITEGIWRTQARHQQLVTLQALARHNPSKRLSTFYAFSLIADDGELQHQPELLQRTWLLDVLKLPQISPPRRKDKTSNPNGTHIIEVRIEERLKPIAHIKTINTDFPLRSSEDLVRELKASPLPQDRGKSLEVKRFTESDVAGVQIQLPLGVIGVWLR